MRRSRQVGIAGLLVAAITGVAFNILAASGALPPAETVARAASFIPRRPDGGHGPAMHATTAGQRQLVTSLGDDVTTGGASTPAPFTARAGAGNTLPITVTINGDASTTTLPGRRSDGWAGFTVVNTSTDEGRVLLESQCSGTDIDVASCRPSVLEIYLRPGESAPVRVQFSTLDAGTDGRAYLIAKAPGVTTPLTSNSMAVTVTAPEVAIVRVPTFQVGPNVDVSQCPAFPGFGGIAVQCGAMLVTHSLPAVTRFGKTFAPTIAFSTARVVSTNIQIDIERPATTAAFIAVQANVYALNASGTRQPASPIWQQTFAGSEWSSTPRRRINTHDLGGQNKQLNRYEVEVAVQTAAGWQPPVSRSGETVPLNRYENAIGSGWSLQGLEELIAGQSDGSVVWIGGDGSTRKYVPRATGDSVYLARSLSRPDTLFRGTASWRRPLPGGARVLFDDAGRHVQTIDRAGRATTFTYVSATTRDSLQSIVLPGSTTAAYTFAYTPAALVISSLGRNVTIARDTANGTYIRAVAAITDPDGATERFQYAAWNRNTAMYVHTDARGTTSWYDWDNFGHTMQAGHVVVAGQQQNLGFGNTNGRSAAPGSGSEDLAQADFSYTGPRIDLSATTSMWVDSLGSVSRVVDAAGHATVIEHGDSRFPGLATRLVHPNGFEQRSSYDAGGRLIAQTNVNPHGDNLDAVTRYVWDTKWDAVTRVTSAEGAVTLTQINPITGNPDWVQSGLDSARRTRFAYDLNRQVTAATEPGLPASGIGYDTLGNVSWTRTPVGFYTLYDRDALGRVHTVISPIDSLSAINVSTLRLNGARSYSHYNLSGLVDSTNTSAADSSGAIAQVITRSVFDAAGDLLALSRRGVPDSTAIGWITTQWTYDALGRQLAEVAPDGAIERHAYTFIGIDTLVTRRGDVITTVYDTLGRVKSRGNALSRSTLTYDAGGGVLTANNASAQVSRAYYPNGQLTSETQRIRNQTTGDFTSHSYTVSYQYDLDGRRTGLVYPTVLGGGTARTHYAAFGAVDTVTTPDGAAFAYGYDLAGRMNVLSYPAPTDLTEQRYFDADGRMTHRLQLGYNYIGASAPGTEHQIHSDYFRYDGRGSKLAAVTMTDSIVNRYNGLGQLVELGSRTLYPTPHQQFTREKFSYDALGNRYRHDYLPEGATQGGAAAGTERYQVGVGRHLTTDHSGLYPDALRYDPNGSLISEGLSKIVRDNNNAVHYVRDSSTYLYDWERHLVVHDRQVVTTGTVYLPPMEGPERDSTAYDALGRRVRTRTIVGDGSCSPTCDALSAVVRYLWDGSQLLGEIHAAGDAAATSSEMESDEPMRTDTIPSQCLNVTICDFPTEPTYRYSPYLGRVQYTHGIEGPDRPLRVLRIDFGGYNNPPANVIIYPHENWRGLIDEVTDGGGHAGLAASDAPLPVDLPARNALAYYNTAGSRAGPRSWVGSLLAQQQDASGLIYMRNRYYNPVTSKFTQEDPIGLAGGLNLYGFAGGDPVNFSDPFGLCPACRGEDNGVRERTGFFRRLWNLYEPCASGSNGDCTPTPLIGEVPNVSGGPAAGFRSFSAFKRAFGSAGGTLQWHHIVGQTAGNIESFGAEAIHDTENLIKVEASVHARISGFYSSKQAFAGGKTVREWLGSQSFAAQREFGLKVLRDFGVIK